MRSSNEENGFGQQAPRDGLFYVEELTHRALNDYTAMLAIIHQAARLVSDQRSGEALAEVALRLRAAAKRCQILRAPRDSSLRDLDQELELLCASLSESMLTPRGITLTLAADQVATSARQCWKILLIISELVTNAARHAFGSRGAGSITITLRAIDGILRCAVTDDGTAERAIFPGRGTAIVDALMCDLGGSISRAYSRNGSAIAFCAPLRVSDFAREQPAEDELSTFAQKAVFAFIEDPENDSK